MQRVTLRVLVLLLAVVPFSAPSVLFAMPIVLDPRIAKVEKFAERVGNTLAFDILINDGSNGFPKGLLVTSGPGRTVSREIFHVSESGAVNIFVQNLAAAEGLAFGSGGAFGTDLYVSESRFPRVIKVDSGGNVSSFATGFTPPFGPADLAFGPGGAFGTDLYVADLTGERIVTVDPTGTVSPFALVGEQAKAIAFDPTGLFGGNLFTTTFHGIPFGGNPGDDAILQIDSSGNSTPFVTGLTGAELITFGPGGVFGSDMFISTIGSLDVTGDGSVSFVDPSGVVHPFLGNIDATTIVFDVNNVLGGGAFVVDGINGEPNPADNNWTIWHVTAVPEPSPFTLFGLGILGLLGYGWYRRKQAA